MDRYTRPSFKEKVSEERANYDDEFKQITLT